MPCQHLLFDPARIPSPCFVLDENQLLTNAAILNTVQERTGAKILLALKGYAAWATFPLLSRFKGHGPLWGACASSVDEARLAREEFGGEVHSFAAAWNKREVAELLTLTDHIVFNSIAQWREFAPAIEAWNQGRCPDRQIQCGLRINPEHSEGAAEIYNPCAPGTRFGVSAEQLPDQLPAHIEGFHCHCHCESGADVFARTLVHIEDHFAKWFPQIKWINFGGGHLMTRADYDVDALVALLRGFHARYPWLRIILEPGSAFGWQTGPLVSQVVDIVEDSGIRTAVLNVSFTCHMPDCLEMPYHPAVRGARVVEADAPGDHVYRLGGCSCLSGDFMASWQFDHALSVGENVIFEDMLHYTAVKTTMFNGIHHPSIALLHTDGELEHLRDYSFSDYRSRMD